MFRINKIKYLFVFVLFIAPSLLQAQKLDVHTFMLENGLEVMVAENHKAPIAKMMLFYKVGAADEAPGKSGLAHLLEHLMFRGTINVSDSKFNDIMLKNGVDFNAFTTQDLTAYHALCDISRLEVVLALEADRMQNLKIDDDAFQSEQKIVYQERQQRIENKPKARFAEDANKILWQNTPYEHPVSGTLDEIKALKKEDAQRFYETYYVPSNAVLVVAGDVTPEELKPMVQKYFGDIKKGAPINRNFSFSVEDGGTYYMTKEMQDIEKANISVSYIVPSVFENKKHAYALYVFSGYFGQNGVHYLKRKLTNEHKVVAASSSVDIFNRGSGEFEISVLPNDNADIQSDLKMINQTLNEAVLSFTPELLEKEKKQFLSWFVYIQDNPSDLASFIGTLKAFGWSDEEIENYTSNIEDVQFEDVQEALKHMLSDSKKMVSVLLPQRKRQ